jgi:hypothetical protein
MKDWQIYSNSKAKQNELGSDSKPSVGEFFFLKVIENGLLIFVCVASVASAAVAIFLEKWEYPSHDTFMEFARLGGGVIMGMVAEKKRR